MAMPQRTDPIWADIISGKKAFAFEFLVVKIFLGYAQFKLKSNPANLPQLANELYNIFEKNQDLPSAQKDLQKFYHKKDNINLGMHSIADIEKLVKNGKTLLLAGDEELLKKIPQGNWIGGTIPYFVASEGGIISKDKIFVTGLPDYIQGVEIQSYDEKDIKNIYVNAPENGFSLLILPATSPVHLSFALEAPQYRDFGVRPVIGWVSGVHLSDLGKVSPKTINGKTGELSDKKAVVMRASLPANRVCDIGIVNIFSQGNGDTLEFIEDGFSAKEVLVNGKRTNFVDYALECKLDIKLPLVANYYGTNINVSFQGIDEKNKVVNFYAPFFKGVQYRHANPITNYVEDFIRYMPKDNENIVFSCNCILNFLYSGFEGKIIGGIVGPITFGEVAYQLLNQTMVYLTVQEKLQLTRTENVLEKQLQERTEELKKSKEELIASDMELRKILPKMEEAFEELEQTQRQLLQSEKMASIGQLAAGVAHEINNPIGFISNNMEILRGYIQHYTQILRVIEQVKMNVDDGDWAKAKSTIDELRKLEKEVNLDYIMNDVSILMEHSKRGLERVEKIVLDLKTFAREDKTENMELIKIEEVIDSILSIVQSEIKYKAELIKEYGKTSLVKGSAQRLGQVLINLLLNASQALKQMGKITIKTYEQDKYVCIDIIDTGQGIPEENLKKIFDPFFTTKPVGQGTGLGLSVSYEIIKKHGGDIQVRSKVGEGSTFTVRLPLHE